MTSALLRVRIEHGSRTPAEQEAHLHGEIEHVIVNVLICSLGPPAFHYVRFIQFRPPFNGIPNGCSEGVQLALQECARFRHQHLLVGTRILRCMSYGTSVPEGNGKPGQSLRSTHGCNPTQLGIVGASSQASSRCNSSECKHHTPEHSWCRRLTTSHRKHQRFISDVSARLRRTWQLRVCGACSMCECTRTKPGRSRRRSTAGGARTTRTQHTQATTGTQHRTPHRHRCAPAPFVHVSIHTPSRPRPHTRT